MLLDFFTKKKFNELNFLNITHRIEPSLSMTLRIEPFFYMTQRIEPFFHLTQRFFNGDSKELNFSLFEYDSKN